MEAALPRPQYERYSSATAEYEDDPDVVEMGVTPVLHHDPLSRLLRVDHADGSHSVSSFHHGSKSATTATTPSTAAATTPGTKR